MGMFSDVFGFKRRRELREKKAADEAALRAKIIKGRLERDAPRGGPARIKPLGEPLTAQRAVQSERRKQDELSQQRRSMVDDASRNSSSPAPVHDALYPMYTSNGTYSSSPSSCSSSSSDSGSSSSDSGSCGGSD